MGILKKIKKSIFSPKRSASIIFAKIDESASKKLFGNTTGLIRSVSGSTKLDKTIESDLEKTNPELYHLKINGFTKYENSYDELFILQLSQKFASLIEDEEFSFPTTGYKENVYSRAIKDPEKNLPELKNLITDDITNFLSKYYKTNFKVKHIQCGRNYAVPEDIYKEKEVFSSYWHMDRRESSELKFFVYLTDVTEKDGPLTIQSKIRTKELLKEGFGNRDHYDLPTDILEDPSHVIKLTGKKGSTMFGNVTVCLHRASVPESGHYRDSIQVFFVPSNEPLDNNWLDKTEQMTYLPKYDPKTGTSSSFYQ